MRAVLVALVLAAPPAAADDAHLSTVDLTAADTTLPLDGMVTLTLPAGTAVSIVPAATHAG